VARVVTVFLEQRYMVLTLLLLRLDLRSPRQVISSQQYLITFSLLLLAAEYPDLRVAEKLKHLESFSGSYDTNNA